MAFLLLRLLPFVEKIGLEFRRGGLFSGMYYVVVVVVVVVLTLTHHYNAVRDHRT